MKYIFVTGGVISGIGKGVCASSIGVILKARNIKVTSIKIDPYINIDAGTFSPYEHGEVFVLNDGGEVDLDLGNYERFLDVTLTRDNNITTGKIYQTVINRERRGDYLGKTVQVVPHITDEIMQWVERVAKQPVENAHGENYQSDVCIVELGGIVGDIESMPYTEAVRQFQTRAHRENVLVVHVSLVPSPHTTGEPKTKPTQRSVHELRGLGLSPDLLFCRCDVPLPDSIKKKLSMFCDVATGHVISVEDVGCLYEVPLVLERQRVADYIIERFGFASDVSNAPEAEKLVASASVPNMFVRDNQPEPMLHPPNRFFRKWKSIIERYKGGVGQEVRIALVGKYVRLHDAYASVISALEHAAVHAKARLKIEYINAEDLEPATAAGRPSEYHKACLLLEQSHGVLVPGGFDQRGIDGKLAAIRHARERRKPYLGICLGLQCAVIELARNVCNLDGANSAEFDRQTSHPVVVEMPEFNPVTKGATMRLGKRRTLFQPAYPDCVTKRLYNAIALQSNGRAADYVDERHRHRYEVNPTYIDRLEKAGMRFVGKDEHGERMEILELAGHPYFVGTQYHPEYQSRPLRPSAPYLGLILASLSAANGQNQDQDQQSEAVASALPHELERYLRKVERKRQAKKNAASAASSGVLSEDSSSASSQCESDDNEQQSPPSPRSPKPEYSSGYANALSTK